MNRQIGRNLLAAVAVVATTSLAASAAMVTGLDDPNDDFSFDGGVDISVVHIDNRPVELTVHGIAGDASIDPMAFASQVFNFTFSGWMGYQLTLSNGATWDQTPDEVFFPDDVIQRGFSIDVDSGRTNATILFDAPLVDDGSSNTIGLDIGFPDSAANPIDQNDPFQDWYIDVPDGFGAGDTFGLTVAPLAAPEPTSLGLVVALGALLARRRR